MLKNVTLIPDSLHGRGTWKLLGPTGVENEPFAIFAKSISRTKSKNTLDVYCRHLAQFFDYLFEASTTLNNLRPDSLLTPGALSEIIEAYDEFLVYGADSGNEIAQAVARTLQSPRNKRKTSALKHAPIRRFLKLSDRIHEQTIELVNAGLLDRQEDASTLMDTRNLKVRPSISQRQAILGNSMLAGVISGGSKLIPVALLPTVLPQIVSDDSRTFPFDRIEEFIQAMPSHRDRMLYSLLAASGCRTHEGLQLLFDDIDIQKREVHLIDPASRPNCKSYLYLTPKERYSLAWKGRTTPKTFLIEPFATMFFDELVLYLKKEYVPHGLHRFVFQYIHRNYLGRPFFLSDLDSRLELFNKILKKCSIKQGVHGPHSLRHAYGTYLLNYFPRLDGSYGLNIGIVQQMMGHMDLKSTQIYARHDHDLFQLELAHANAMIFNKGLTKSLVQMKIDALNGKVRDLEIELKAEIQRRLSIK